MKHRLLYNQRSPLVVRRENDFHLVEKRCPVLVFVEAGDVPTHSAARRLVLRRNWAEQLVLTERSRLKPLVGSMLRLHCRLRHTPSPWRSTSV
ncbi:hypothetical protein EYF80_047723 [Liparis tanakae]|uniref:Uncharacterized protein n=1 Tax=Liparis tanakae TaxID=230148 RepID=A0A4Z2FLS1_9TELE|nr:hypothetical protein EYF80_047723 [Liparis tanakae]